MENLSYLTFHKQNQLIKILSAIVASLSPHLLVKNHFFIVDLCAGGGLRILYKGKAGRISGVVLDESVLAKNKLVVPGSALIIPHLLDQFSVRYKFLCFEPDEPTYAELQASLQAYRNLGTSFGEIMSLRESASAAVHFVKMDPKAKHGLLYADPNGIIPVQAAVDCAKENPNLDVLLHLSGTALKRATARGLAGYRIEEYITAIPHSRGWISQPVGAQYWTFFLFSPDDRKMKDTGMVDITSPEGRRRYDLFRLTAEEQGAPAWGSSTRAKYVAEAGISGIPVVISNSLITAPTNPMGRTKAVKAIGKAVGEVMFNR